MSHSQRAFLGLSAFLHPSLATLHPVRRGQDRPAANLGMRQFDSADKACPSEKHPDRIGGSTGELSNMHHLQPQNGRSLELWRSSSSSLDLDSILQRSRADILLHPANQEIQASSVNPTLTEQGFHCLFFQPVPFKVPVLFQRLSSLVIS